MFYYSTNVYIGQCHILVITAVLALHDQPKYWVTSTYRSIFISDVHLGTRDCKAEALNNFLKHNTCETLYLVGDIIDAWKIQRNKWR